jgi:hypothetical protein
MMPDFSPLGQSASLANFSSQSGNQLQIYSTVWQSVAQSSVSCITIGRMTNVHLKCRPD